jgi:hypothetical protein
MFENIGSVVSHLPVNAEAGDVDHALHVQQALVAETGPPQGGAHTLWVAGLVNLVGDNGVPQPGGGSDCWCCPAGTPQGCAGHVGS